MSWAQCACVRMQVCQQTAPRTWPQPPRGWQPSAPGEWSTCGRPLCQPHLTLAVWSLFRARTNWAFRNIRFVHGTWSCGSNVVSARCFNNNRYMITTWAFLSQPLFKYNDWTEDNVENKHPADSVTIQHNKGKFLLFYNLRVLSVCAKNGKNVELPFRQKFVNYVFRCTCI